MGETGRGFIYGMRTLVVKEIDLYTYMFTSQNSYEYIIFMHMYYYTSYIGMMSTLVIWKYKPLINTYKRKIGELIKERKA